jgi:hypothetical protein
LVPLVRLPHLARGLLHRVVPLAALGLMVVRRVALVAQALVVTSISQVAQALVV